MDLEHIDTIRKDFKKETGRYPAVLIFDEFFIEDLVDDIASNTIYQASDGLPLRQSIVQDLYEGKFNYRGTLIVPETMVIHAQGGGYNDEGDYSD